MKKIVLLFAIVAVCSFTRCTSDNTLISESPSLVVRAYLYAEEPVTDIQISMTFALGSDLTSGPSVNDAIVTLEKNGSTYPLTLSAGDSGYYHYPNNDLQVKVGDIFRIFVEYDGQTVTAETVIPEPPIEVDISDNTFFIDPEARPGRFNDDTSSVDISWNNPDESYYFVTITNQEDALTQINEFTGRFGGFRSFRSQPTQEDTYVIRRLDLTYWGTHEIRVYKVNKVYADLYAVGFQDSRNLNEPETNIQNGLGIFAGFSSAAVTLEVVPE